MPTREELDASIATTFGQTAPRSLSAPEIGQELTNLADYVDEAVAAGGGGGTGLPAGGATGNTLVKNSGSNGDASWGALAAASVTQTSSNRFVSDTEKTTWNGKANASHSHSLSDLTQSGATEGQSIVWSEDEGAWIPADSNAGAGIVPYTVLSGTNWDFSAAGHEKKKITLTEDTEVIIENEVNGSYGELEITGNGYNVTINGITKVTDADEPDIAVVTHTGTKLYVYFPVGWEDAGAPPSEPEQLNTAVLPATTAVPLNVANGWGTYEYLLTHASLKITTPGTVTRMKTHVGSAASTMTVQAVKIWRAGALVKTWVLPTGVVGVNTHDVNDNFHTEVDDVVSWVGLASTNGTNNSDIVTDAESGVACKYAVVSDETNTTIPTADLAPWCPIVQIFGTPD